MFLSHVWEERAEPWGQPCPGRLSQPPLWQRPLCNEENRDRSPDLLTRERKARWGPALPPQGGRGLAPPFYFFISMCLGSSAGEQVSLCFRKLPA